jgi:hypothetical protein
MKKTKFKVGDKVINVGNINFFPFNVEVYGLVTHITTLPDSDCESYSIDWYSGADSTPFGRGSRQVDQIKLHPQYHRDKILKRLLR